MKNPGRLGGVLPNTGFPSVEHPSLANRGLIDHRLAPCFLPLAFVGKVVSSPVFVGQIRESPGFFKLVSLLVFVRPCSESQLIATEKIEKHAGIWKRLW